MYFSHRKTEYCFICFSNLFFFFFSFAICFSNEYHVDRLVVIRVCFVELDNLNGNNNSMCDSVFQLTVIRNVCIHVWVKWWIWKCSIYYVVQYHLEPFHHHPSNLCTVFVIRLGNYMWCHWCLCVFVLLSFLEHAHMSQLCIS